MKLKNLPCAISVQYFIFMILFTFYCKSEYFALAILPSAVGQGVNGIIYKSKISLETLLWCCVRIKKLGTFTLLHNRLLMIFKVTLINHCLLTFLNMYLSLIKHSPLTL